MMVVYLVAREVMAVLQCVGYAFSMSDAMLGITLLAWGNSIGGEWSKAIAKCNSCVKLFLIYLLCAMLDWRCMYNHVINCQRTFTRWLFERGGNKEIYIRYNNKLLQNYKSRGGIIYCLHYIPVTCFRVLSREIHIIRPLLF